MDMGTITTSVQQVAQFSIYNVNPVELPIAITKSKLSSSSSSTKPAAATSFDIVTTIGSVRFSL
eukprot:17775-Heterococcus_DN1.PRE.4